MSEFVNSDYDIYCDTAWVDSHSVNCYFCNDLVDERKCIPADPYNGNDGGDICPKCLNRKEILANLLEDLL